LGKITIKDLPENRKDILQASIPDLQMLKLGIPDFAQVIEYRMTPDTLLVWLLDKHKLVMRRIAISSRQLEALVLQFLQSIGAVDADTFKSRVKQDIKAVYDENCQFGRQLYQFVLAPIADAISPDKILFIIPDGVLHRLPFGALVTDDGRFFDESHVWAKSPSLSILAESVNWQKQSIASKSNRLLMIGGDFSSVRSQKRSLSNVFVNPIILEKEAATYETLQVCLQEGADVVYFSVHAVADARSPMNSYVELYNNHGTDGLLQKRNVYARELLALDFSRTKLIVLNACETATGKFVHGEGVLNMVRVFSLSQVPIVVASLWKNDDRQSAQIMNEFFKGVVNAQEPAHALHQAKRLRLQKLKQDHHFPLPYFWTVFEVYNNSWMIQSRLELN
jgi:CHAT domain-containing protein